VSGQAGTLEPLHDVSGRAGATRTASRGRSASSRLAPRLLSAAAPPSAAAAAANACERDAACPISTR